MARPYYTAALAALQAAHDACLRAPDRPVLGMSSGPFSGVNVALGIVSELEQELERMRLRERQRARVLRRPLKLKPVRAQAGSLG